MKCHNISKQPHHKLFLLHFNTAEFFVGEETCWIILQLITCHYVLQHQEWTRKIHQ